jgi:Serine acetyltransferase
VFENIKKDLRRYDENLISAIPKALTKLGFLALINYRFGRFVRLKVKIPILKQLIWGLTGLSRLAVNVITGVDLPYSAKIEGGMKICHFGTIFISSKTIIGENCTLHQGVTIGKGGHNTESGEPILGNDVFIGVNATIIGPITIGSHVKIGSNVCCFKDIPNDATVVTTGIRVIQK